MMIVFYDAIIMASPCKSSPSYLTNAYWAPPTVKPSQITCAVSLPVRC